MQMILCRLLLQEMVTLIYYLVIIILNILNYPTEYDLFEVEDVFAELQELVSKNRFQDGDLISKSSHTRVKRKSGKIATHRNPFMHDEGLKFNKIPSSLH